MDLHFFSSKSTLETLMSMRFQDIFMLEAAWGVAQLSHGCGEGGQHLAEGTRITGMIHVLSNPSWPPSGLLKWPTVVLGALIHSLSYHSEKNPKTQQMKELILPLLWPHAWAEMGDSAQTL